ncbi:hypothetical protein V6Z12_D12G259300 [Gossypium hirsutum]
MEGLLQAGSSYFYYKILWLQVLLGKELFIAEFTRNSAVRYSIGDMLVSSGSWMD